MSAVDVAAVAGRAIDRLRNANVEGDVVLLAPGDGAPRARPHRTVVPIALAFGALVIAGALRAPYAYAAWLVLVELAAWAAVCVLAAAACREFPRTLFPFLLAIAKMFCCSTLLR